MTALPNLSVALLHYPVYNKSRDVITSAVSNLDLHDIARAAKTYGIRAYYVVTPLTDQRHLARRLVSHWTQGPGAAYNPDRKEALDLVRVVESLEAAIQEIAEHSGARPVTVVTDAGFHPKSIGYVRLAEMLKDGRPALLLFGTAWGLTREFIASADHVLNPVEGPTRYNHLSVRSATAIILDRIFGGRA